MHIYSEVSTIAFKEFTHTGLQLKSPNSHNRDVQCRIALLNYLKILQTLTTHELQLLEDLGLYMFVYSDQSSDDTLQREQVTESQGLET